jgi:hypothetical protein
MKRLVFALLLSLASTVCMAADVPHYGDFTDDDAVHDFPLSTFNVSTGALATVTNVADGTSAITVVHVDSATAITTLDTIDLDVGVTGNHVVTLDFSAATLSAGIYEARITDADATVGSLAVTNFPIFRFSVAQYTSSAGVESIVDTRADTTDGLIGDVQTDVDTLVTGVNVLTTDTHAEPGQGAPAATATLVAKINYIYKYLRNKKTQTASQFSLFADDASTVDQKATVSDDGATTTVGEQASGP